MLDFLTGYIGLSPDIAPATSGLYINQLPGVSLGMMGSLADVEQADYLGLWAEVQKRALLKFGLAVKKGINGSYSITDNSVVDCLVTGAKDSFGLSLWYFLGVELMIERTSSDRLNRYTTIELDKAEKLKADFYAEFQAALEDAVGSLDINGSDCITTCLEYSGPVRFVEQTP